MKAIKGECFGIELFRADYMHLDELREHTVCQLLVEDDGNWHNMGSVFDAAWIDEMISVLQTAKGAIKFLSSSPTPLHSDNS